MALVPARLLVPPRTRPGDCPCSALRSGSASFLLQARSVARAPGSRVVACSFPNSAAAVPQRDGDLDRDRDRQQEEGEDAAPAPRWRNGGRPWAPTFQASAQTGDFRQNPPPWMSRGITAPPGPAKRREAAAEVGKGENDDEGEEEEEGESSSGAVTGSRTGSKSAMSRIVEKLQGIRGGKPVMEKKSYLGYSQQQQRRGQAADSVFTQRPAVNKKLFSKVSPQWSSPDHPVPTPAFPDPAGGNLDARFPWEIEDEFTAGSAEEKKKKVKPPSLAELTIPAEELKRLRGLGLHTRHRLKIGRLGVTDGVVDFVHDGWRISEIVKIKCEGAPALNMKKTHEDLERKTGGLVVWRSGGALIIYRGKDYVHPSKLPESVLEMRRRAPTRTFHGLAESRGQVNLMKQEGGEKEELAAVNETVLEDVFTVTDELASASTELVPDGFTEQESGSFATSSVKEDLLSEIASGSASFDRRGMSDIMERELEEVERILEGLGPRYEGWTGVRPVPVDGDLLFLDEASFKKPFRLLPYGVKPSLNNNELTDLRRLARPLPPHFVLGRNRGLAGLASAIIKLWERSEIAKIAIKRGVQNTNNERMAEELRRYTGGILLSRNKEFVVLYRGKDFLPPLVAKALEEREALTKSLQEEEEKLRFEGSIRKAATLGLPVEESAAGTLVETLEAKAQWVTWHNSEEERKNRESARIAARRAEVDKIERKMQDALSKKQRAEDSLMKVEKSLQLSGPPTDSEYITEEERHMFRKIGLKMKAFLLIGRRGVFDGVVENMHLHWKHRELVKILVKERDPRELERTAKMLAYESGGVLIATVQVSKGQAIIVYRGKNYQRPLQIRPRRLLTKREALKRSIELQRREALERHILNLEKQIETMKSGLERYGLDGKRNPVKDYGRHDVNDLPTPKGGEQMNNDRVDNDNDEGWESDTGTNSSVTYRADPLSIKERLVLRRHALKVMGKTANFHVGKSNVLTGVAAAVREHFKRNALVKIGVKGRAKGTSVQELLEELEALTGGVLVCQEGTKVIMFRGWAEGQPKPVVADEEPLSPELLHALRIEDAEDEDDYYSHDHLNAVGGDSEIDEGNESDVDTEFDVDSDADEAELNLEDDSEDDLQDDDVGLAMDDLDPWSDLEDDGEDEENDGVENRPLKVVDQMLPN